MGYYGDRRCVACGKRFDGNNHHCSTSFEAGKKAAQTRANNEEIRLIMPETKVSFNKRLAVGFSMLGEGYNE